MCCERCDHLSSDGVVKCEQCGFGKVFWVPSLAEIQEACERIRAAWTPQEERSRRCRRRELFIPDVAYEIPRVVEATDGRRRKPRNW